VESWGRGVFRTSVRFLGRFEAHPDTPLPSASHFLSFMQVVMIVKNLRTLLYTLCDPANENVSIPYLNPEDPPIIGKKDLVRKFP